MNRLKRFFLESSTHTDLGLLIIRLGIGLSMLLFHGYGKLTGGTSTWEAVGSHMKNLGITFFPVFWGLLAALAESVGSLLLVLGVFFRPATLALVFTMLVAALRHLTLPAEAPGAGWSGASHALELLAVYLGLLAAGPGKYRLRF